MFKLHYTPEYTGIARFLCNNLSLGEFYSCPRAYFAQFLTEFAGVLYSAPIPGSEKLLRLLVVHKSLVKASLSLYTCPNLVNFLLNYYHVNDIYGVD